MEKYCCLIDSFHYFRYHFPLFVSITLYDSIPIVFFSLDNPSIWFIFFLNFESIHLERRSFENNHLRLSGSSKMVPSRNLLDRKRCICFSIGYFLYDSLLSIANYRKYPDRLEIIIHHLITTITLGQIFCPIIRVRFPKLIDYCSYGLVIEISNIFIHIRSLGYISDFWSNNLLLFKLNSFLAIGKRNWFNWFIFLLFFFLSLFCN